MKVISNLLDLTVLKNCHVHFLWLKIITQTIQTCIGQGLFPQEEGCPDLEPHNAEHKHMRNADPWEKREFSVVCSARTQRMQNPSSAQKAM
jgi:hypothetical protein